MGNDAPAIPEPLQERLDHIARELGQRVYPDGLPWGTTFSELEEIAGTLGDEIARRLIQEQLQQQAMQEPGEADQQCPCCGRAARSAPEQPRQLQTTQGLVAWTEPVGHCPHCRRAFFPSEPSLGSGSDRPEPQGPAEDRLRRGQQHLLRPGRPRPGHVGGTDRAGQAS